MNFAFLKHIKVLIALYLAVIAVFVYLGYTYYLDSRVNELAERSKELSSISNLKHTAILNWFDERKSDAEFLFYNQPLQCLVNEYIKSGSVTDSAQIVGMISSMYRNHDYSNILIRSLSGKVIINLNPESDIVFFSDSLNSSIDSKRIVFSDIYPDSINHLPAMDIYIPIECSGNFAAIIIIKIDLERLLYPIISSWYVDESSGEALIVRAEKDSIVSLSPLKFSGKQKLFIKRSITDNKLPAAKAIRGAVDIVEGVDYRGKEVLADVKPIKKLNWYLVTKMDLSEVYAPVNEQTLTNLFILGLITFLGGLALLYYHTKLNYNHLKKVSEVEQKLKDILDYSTNAFYSHTTDHRLTYMSHQSSAILGYSPEELKMKWTELVTDNPINVKGIELTNLAIQTGKTQPPYELELYKKNGEKVWVEVREAPVLKNGKTISIVGALTDITKRKEAEDKLKILSKAVEQSPVSVLITDPAGNIQYVNQAFTVVTGYSLNEIYGSNPRILKSGEQSDQIYKELWQTILNGQTWHGELLNKKKNGEQFWESVTISPIISENGIVTNFIAIKDDITEKKKNEEILRENEEKFRLIFDNSSEALFLSWPDGKIEAANPAACKMFGYTSEELIKFGRDAIIEKSDGKFEKLLNERIKNGTIIGETTFIRKSGEKFIGELSSSIFKDKDANFRISTIVRDVTEKKRIEQAIIESKEKAEEASHIKSNFLATMSHELRTPLVGILGYAELLSSELKNREQAEMANTILVSGNRLLETLNSILDISRIEANKLEYTETAINLIEVLNESVNLFKPVALDKRLYLRSSFPNTSVLVNSDKDLLLKIFNNLISNSVKYTRNGGVEVIVTLETEQSAAYVLTVVKDTGIGISSEYHNIVFEPFRQVSEGMARVFDGTGLGLAITKRLVEILNGKIYFESAPGEGTSFYVKFPVHSEESDDEVQIDSNIIPDEKITPHEIELDKLILLVEDDISNALMIKTYIQDYFNVDHVLNGFDAIQKCKLKKYDAILMDINLKGIDGVETFRRIKQLDEYNSQIPAIAITAYAMKGDKEKFLASGFNYYIPKPFKHSELLNILFKIFK